MGIQHSLTKSILQCYSPFVNKSHSLYRFFFLIQQIDYNNVKNDSIQHAPFEPNSREDLILLTYVVSKLVNVKDTYIYKMLDEDQDLDFVVAEEVITEWIIKDFGKDFQKNCKVVVLEESKKRTCVCRLGAN